ncbi:S41 family peptidase [Mucilaginibacter ginkgonis]|uniref:Uncharacterized protein n=1 Tax=Mucilaginibacter ginkgonis TaxID=2682091 RepID=A0A6I4HX88_9SPHI|nr:S41 family peptidase [Mucilaginibacter ginkgonis]QQL50970.1 hypothetical protein GO620_005830 [Mucilaginibacter ginkgonis]
MNRNFIYLLSAIAVLSSCVKGINNPTNGSLNSITGGTTATTGSTVTGSSTVVADAIKDSVYYYTKEDYYWADAIPDYNTFAPRTAANGTTDILALTNEVNKLSQYKINSATSLPYEYVSTNVGKAKYFYIDAGQTTLRLNAVSGDFGFGRAYRNATDLRVSYVNPGSPAANAGMVRGSQITAINGTTSLNNDGANGTNTAFINSAMAGSIISVAATKPDGTKVTYNLTAAIYADNPILKTQTITLANGKKAGYIVFNSFVTQATAKPLLDAAFAKFVVDGISELIVDVRYNGGGYTETAQYLLNLIAPATASNNTMFTATYNPALQGGKQLLLKNQLRKDASGTTFNYGQVDYSLTSQTFKFGSTHPLNLTRVFFLTTGATASSSEATINALRPYMNVQLVGGTTYGKPIGFIDIKIGTYTMYLPAFEIRNANGDSNYYNGMTPGSSTYPGYATADDLTHDFGDSNEGLLSAVVNYLNGGVYKSNSTSTVGVQSIGSQNYDSSVIDADQFKGMLFQYPKHK